MWCVAHYHDAIMMVIKPQSKDIKPQDLLQITTLTESTARHIFSIHEKINLLEIMRLVRKKNPSEHM